jgi:hypothetical protein
MLKARLVLSAVLAGGIGISHASAQDRWAAADQQLSRLDPAAFTRSPRCRRGAPNTPSPSTGDGPSQLSAGLRGARSDRLGGSAPAPRPPQRSRLG